MCKELHWVLSLEIKLCLYLAVFSKMLCIYIYRYRYIDIFFLPTFPFPSGNHYTVACVLRGFFVCLFVCVLLNTFTFITQPSISPPLRQLSVFSLNLFLFFVSLFYVKNKEILPFWTAWPKLSEMSIRERRLPYERLQFCESCGWEPWKQAPWAR